VGSHEEYLNATGIKLNEINVVPLQKISKNLNRIKLRIMKTTKTKATNKQMKTSETGKASGSKKVTTSKSSPTEEEIRIKAKEIYHERIARGEHGTSADDWNKAEKLLKGSKK
jgi:hypothetical protein